MFELVRFRGMSAFPYTYSRNAIAHNYSFLRCGVFDEWGMAPYLSENLLQYGIASQIASEAFAVEGITVEYDFFHGRARMRWPKLGNGMVLWCAFTP